MNGAGQSMAQGRVWRAPNSRRRTTTSSPCTKERRFFRKRAGRMEGGLQEAPWAVTPPAGSVELVEAISQGCVSQGRCGPELGAGMETVSLWRDNGAVEEGFRGGICAGLEKVVWKQVQTL